MHQPRSMTREIGTAFAVLAIYLLTILAPMHQARASQLAFQELGYTTIESGWVLCTPEAQPGDERDILVAKCPAAGVGKPAAVAPTRCCNPASRDTPSTERWVSPTSGATNSSRARPPDAGWRFRTG